eukprot:TRINITY_DN5717_c0_g1_i1.p1 TRINITY_DN5717_c0_g1~~TRINITY_DN5717_c0_g1_i1.p1  ORF type:complete len:165 (+),score=39.28 TRINITY_DN5717_c0_g1_i1:129-623(+)
MKGLGFGCCMIFVVEFFCFFVFSQGQQASCPFCNNENFQLNKTATSFPLPSQEAINKFNETWVVEKLLNEPNLELDPGVTSTHLVVRFLRTFTVSRNVFGYFCFSKTQNSSSLQKKILVKEVSLSTTGKDCLHEGDAIDVFVQCPPSLNMVGFFIHPNSTRTLR